MILRFLTLATAVCWISAELTDDEILSLIFGTGPNQVEEKEVQMPKCNGIEGTAIGCYECYPCRDEVLTSRLNKITVAERFRLNDGSCNTSVQVCCVGQTDLRDRSSDKCGASNPNGKPRRRRQKLRSVLRGEYPWRAWVFIKSNLDQPLCAATYINEFSRALIAPASCVQRYPAENLRVSFIKYARHQEAVGQVIVHEDFDSSNHHNDIAILTLRSMETAPDWLTEACIPYTPPPHATPCITISSEDLFVNTVIPLKTKCAKNGAELHPSQMCAIAPPHDYVPETGAGLYCVEQHPSMSNYIVHGMALLQQDEGVTTYTNVSHFTKWIHQKLNLP